MSDTSLRLAHRVIGHVQGAMNPLTVNLARTRLAEELDKLLRAEGIHPQELDPKKKYAIDRLNECIEFMLRDEEYEEALLKCKNTLAPMFRGMSKETKETKEAK